MNMFENDVKEALTCIEKTKKLAGTLTNNISRYNNNCVNAGLPNQQWEDHQMERYVGSLNKIDRMVNNLLETTTRPAFNTVFLGKIFDTRLSAILSEVTEIMQIFAIVSARLKFLENALSAQVEMFSQFQRSTGTVH